jgi:hypothetical protein
MTDNKDLKYTQQFKPYTEIREVRYVENKQSGLSPVARTKVVNRSGSNYVSERATIINPSYGPASEVTIASSSEIVFISSQKYGESSWERTEEAGDNHGSTGSIKQGNEWQTRTLSIGVFGNEETARLILQKLENGEIKVEKKAEFKCDFSSDYGSSFYCIPHHETAESRRLKDETIKAFRENAEAQKKLREVMMEKVRTSPFFLPVGLMDDSEFKKLSEIKKI